MLLHGRQQNWQQSFLHVGLRLVDQLRCLGKEGGGGRPEHVCRENYTHVYQYAGQRSTKLQLNPRL